MKPVELVARALANSSKVGDRVFDPFLGSGTTAVAAINGQLARLWRKGIRLVRMTWIMRVWVMSDSTNQPV